MALMKTLGTGQGLLKAGILGFAGAGKTWTSMLLAIGTRKHFGLTGPIALFDTEGGSEYVAPMVRQATGVDLVGVRARSLTDLLATGQEALSGGVSIFVVDSISHVWAEVMESHMSQINESLSRRKLPLRKRLEFQDMAELKRIWERWTTFYLNSNLHIIVCGRAGYTWDFEKDEETGKKELIKTGVRMKVENDFGFEPSLLVEMEREQESDGKGGFKIVRRATILKDRFGVIDGLETTNPTFEFFAPHVRMLKAGAHAPVDTELKTDTGASGDDGDGAWARERKTRAILCEEIQGELVNAFPTQTADDKKRKTDIVHETFGTRSWTAVESMNSEKLREGLRKVRRALGIGEPPAEEVGVGVLTQTAAQAAGTGAGISEGETGERAPSTVGAAAEGEAKAGGVGNQADPVDVAGPLADVGGPRGEAEGAGKGNPSLTETARSLMLGEVRRFADKLEISSDQWAELMKARGASPDALSVMPDAQLADLHRHLGVRINAAFPVPARRGRK